MGEKTLSTRRSLFDRYKDIFFIVLGILSYSVGYTAFILPERVVMGGASGIAALIYYATEIQTWISLLILNCTFLLIALKALNLQFVVRTVTGVGILLFFVGILQPFFAANPIITSGKDTNIHLLIGCAIRCAHLLFLPSLQQHGEDSLWCGVYARSHHLLRLRHQRCTPDRAVPYHLKEVSGDCRQHQYGRAPRRNARGRQGMV